MLAQQSVFVNDGISRPIKKMRQQKNEAVTMLSFLVSCRCRHHV